VQILEARDQEERRQQVSRRTEESSEGVAAPEFEPMPALQEVGRGDSATSAPLQSETDEMPSPFLARGSDEPETWKPIARVRRGG
jgi:hypothetical protein